MADTEDDEYSTAIDLIKNTFYVEKPSRQTGSRAADTFQHPFDSRILLNSSVDDTSYHEFVERVLEIGKSQPAASESMSRSLTVDDEVATYLALPSQVKQQLRDMFVKARLTVESKPRGSIMERKPSYASTSSHRHPLIASRRKKSRKLSNVSRSSQLSDLMATSRRKSGLTEFTKECRNGSHEKSVASADQSSLNNRRSKTMPYRNRIHDDSYVKSETKTDFFVTPFYYNSLWELDDAEDNTEAQENESAQINSFMWSKRENSRRKVTRWLRKTTNLT